MWNEVGDWNRTVREYCRRLELGGGELKKTSKLELRSRIMRWALQDGGMSERVK